MFTPTYFPPTYFAPTYFPNFGAVLVAYGSLFEAIRAAWADAGLNEDVGKLYLDQMPRGKLQDVLPCVVMTEMLRRTRGLAYSHWTEDVTVRFAVIAVGEANALRLARTMERGLAAASVPESEEGRVIRFLPASKTLARDPATWPDNAPVARRTVDFRGTLVTENPRWS